MNNSEILYLYDAKLTNPNGDPDEENRPRMDYQRDINLVSDLRIKRYIRDYLLSRNKELFVQKVENKSVTAAVRMEKDKDLTIDQILEKFIDVRMFGATMPIKEGTKTFIGPIQFNWGYSLNKVSLIEASITSHFASDKGNEQGAIGKDYRVKYSFIAFGAVVSGKRAEHTNLKEEDLTIFDGAMKNAIPELITRSKIGQYPRLYLRVEYVDNETILGDLRSFVKLIEEVEDVRDISEVSLEIGELAEFLQNNKNRIKAIHYYKNPQLKLLYKGKETKLEEALNGLKLESV